MKSWRRTVLRPFALARFAACSRSQYMYSFRAANASPAVLQPAFLRTPFALLAMTSDSRDFLAILELRVGRSGELRKLYLTGPNRETFLSMKPVSFDATTAECLVFTFKAGLLSGVAHDLKLRVDQFEIAVDDQGVHARFDASSLRVVCARAGGKDDLRALSERDRREIEATIARDVLEARNHPAIDFRSSTLAATVAPAEMQIDGTLSIRGRE